MLITLSGLDGAGKSTLIAALRRELERQRRPVTVLHLNDHVGVYAWLRALRDRLLDRARPLVEAPPRMTPSPTLLGRLRDTIVWSAGLRRLLYPLDLLFFLAVRLYVEAIRGRILIVDRYFYDRLVDVAPRGKRGWGWLRLLARITPKPDVAVLLEISAAEAFARKGEYTIPYLARREAAYARVFSWFPAAVRLSGRDPQAAAHALAGIVGRRIETQETILASAALRLLLTQDVPPVDTDQLDWAALRTVAKRGGVLVGLADAMTRRGETLPPRFAAAAADACVRTERVLELVDRLGDACTRHGIAHAFLKTVERYPDTGHDVDLLVGDASPAVDRVILRDVPATLRTRGFRNRLAGATTYTAAYGIVIDIRHGRLGQLGEHARYARILLGRAGPATAGSIMCRAPAPEDNLLLLAAQQIYVRPAFRLADVYWMTTTLRDRQLNWDYVFATALSMGLVPTVGAYLEYVDRVHLRLVSRPLVAADVLARFQVGSAPAQQDTRYPESRAAARLYLRHVRATLESGRWHSAARLSLLPVVAALAAGTRKSA